MSAEEYYQKSSGALQNWVVTLVVLFAAFSGVVIALVCIFALPDQSVRPLLGSLFYLGGAVFVIGLLFLRWKKEKAEEIDVIDRIQSNKIIIKENVNDKIIKWVVAVYCIMHSIDGFAIALICIFALPDQTSQPKTGILYFLSSTIMLGCFIIVVWKNWSSKRHMA